MSVTGPSELDREPVLSSEGRLEEELRLARIEIVHIKKLAAELARELEEREFDLSNVSAHATRDRQQLKKLRSSLSWRITMPLRVVHRDSARRIRRKRAK